MERGGDDLGRSARRLIRQSRVATLATAGRVDSPAAGHSYGSLVLVAADYDAAPLLLISRLAEHTQNIAQDPRVSLLFEATAGLVDPLTGPRLTLLGVAEPAERSGQRTRFLARHPSAADYAGFADFSLVRVRAIRAHLVAGFGRINWIEAESLTFEIGSAQALIRAEAGIVAHMNADHADALSLYATVLLGSEPGDLRMTGIDPEGLDLRASPARVLRLDFESPVRDGAEARERLVDLAQRARRAGAANRPVERS